MKEVSSERKVFRFGDHELDPRTRCLSRSGMKVRLREQLFVVLSSLLERPGEVVPRDELRQRLWPGDVVVDFELNLNTIVARLREALGDSAEHPRYIETLPKLGYRLIAVVSEGQARGQAPQRRFRLIVLPFSSAGSEPVEEYFRDAMTDEVISALCRVDPGLLAVIARTTALHYKNSGKDVAQIGIELGVDYVVEGAVRRDANRFSMNVKLIRSADQAHVLARTYDAELKDVFTVADRAASEIAGGIGLAPAHPDERTGPTAGALARKNPTEDLTAYNEYIQARYEIGKGSVAGFTAAGQHLERAVARDPRFALAHDALAEIDWYLGYFGYIPPRKAFSAGIVHAIRAVELDPGRAETHALLGEFHKTLEYNWPEVHREMALALELDPASPLVRLRYAVSELMPHGRLEEAIAEIQKALELDPLFLLTQGWLGIMFLLAHKWDLAIDQANLLLRLYPRAFWGHYVKGVAFREQQMFQQAIDALRTALEASGGLPGMVGWLGLTLGLAGDRDGARLLLERVCERATKGYVPPTSFAWIHLGLGELDKAFEWLDRAVEERDQFMMPIRSYKFLDPIRTDPRFPLLVRKMNLEP